VKSIQNFDDLYTLGRTFDVPVGNYDVKWKIPSTWNGSIKGEEFLKITSGTLVVVDPCYVIGRNSNEGWLKWLNDANFFTGHELNDRKDYGLPIGVFVLDEMGGDGSYNVHLSLKDHE
jgi:hypothetical protein